VVRWDRYVETVRLTKDEAENLDLTAAIKTEIGRADKSIQAKMLERDRWWIELA